MAPEADGGDLRLPGLIKAARRTSGLTQAEVGSELGEISYQQVSKWELGKSVPTPENLVKLHELLFREVSPDERDPLSEWLLRYAESSAAGSQTEVVSAEVDKSVAVLRRTPSLERRLTPPFSLSDFPDAFLPLTIICGDRRESPFKTAGDLLVYSVSITDVTFLLRLGINDRRVTIKSDKLLAIADDRYLRRTLGKTNLLVIGSPAVNLAARVINDGSIFRINYPKDITAFEQLLRSKTRGPSESGLNLNESDTLRVFGKMWDFTRQVSSPSEHEAHGFTLDEAELEQFRATLPADEQLKFKELLPTLADHMTELFAGNRDPASWMNQFRKPGLVDPADGMVHGETTLSGNDFGFISLAPHPFADPNGKQLYVSILVCGIHGPGTAHALRALAENDFADHPLGGILEVSLDEMKGWPARFEEAGWQWQTKPYKPQKVIDNLRRAQKNPADSAFSNLEARQIDEVIGFVKRVSEIS